MIMHSSWREVSLSVDRVGESAMSDVDLRAALAASVTQVRAMHGLPPVDLPEVRAEWVDDQDAELYAEARDEEHGARIARYCDRRDER